jgi:hypothetical protein
MLNSIYVSHVKFCISNKVYIFFNDRWILENTYEKRGYAYLRIISPEI